MILERKGFWLCQYISSNSSLGFCCEPFENRAKVFPYGKFIRRRRHSVPQTFTLRPWVKKERFPSYIIAKWSPDHPFFCHVRIPVNQYHGAARVLTRILQSEDGREVFRTSAFLRLLIDNVYEDSLRISSFSWQHAERTPYGSYIRGQYCYGRMPGLVAALVF